MRFFFTQENAVNVRSGEKLIIPENCVMFLGQKPVGLH
jgi:hypothetical protein